MTNVKRYTETEFVNLLKTAKISYGQDEQETIDVYHGNDEMRLETWGYGWVNLTLSDGTEISHVETYQYPQGKPSEATWGEDKTTSAWVTPGQHRITDFAVVDEDGDELDNREMELLINKTVSVDIESNTDLGEDELEEIDMDSSTGKQFELKRSNGLDVRFVGSKIGEAESSTNNASSSYSGSIGIWTEYRLYRTDSGKLVLGTLHGTQWQGSSDEYKVDVFESEADLIAHLEGEYGLGWLEKELLEDAGIEAVEEIA